MTFSNEHGVSYELGAPTNFYSDYQTTELSDTLIAEEIPQSEYGKVRVQQVISMEQIARWDYCTEGDMEFSEDHLRGFVDGKRYVCEALTRYLKTTFPDLADAQIHIALEDFSVHDESLSGPYMNLKLPEGFEWNPDGDGEPVPVEDETVVPLAV